MDKFWDRVQYLMDRDRLSQQDLSDKINLSVAAIKSGIYRGNPPRPEVVYNLAKLFNVPMEYLMVGEVSLTIESQEHKQLMYTISELEKNLSTLKEQVDKFFTT